MGMFHHRKQSRRLPSRIGTAQRVRKFAETDLEPYPDYVMATSDFAGGQRFEIFEIVDPWETLKGDFLLVKAIQGGSGSGMIMVPASIVEPSHAPTCLKDALAV